MEYIKLKTLEDVLGIFISKERFKEFKENFKKLESKDKDFLESHFLNLQSNESWNIYRGFLYESMHTKVEELKIIEKKNLEHQQGFISGVEYVMAELGRFCDQREQERRDKEKALLEEERRKTPFGKQ